MLARRKLAMLGETPPVWLPDYAVAEAKPLHVVGLVTLGFALAKELSGEAQLERAQKNQSSMCHCQEQNSAGICSERRTKSSELYVETTERRFNGINRCC